METVDNAWSQLRVPPHQVAIQAIVVMCSSFFLRQQISQLIVVT